MKAQLYKNMNYRNNTEKMRNYQQQSFMHSVPQNQTSYIAQPMSYYVSIFLQKKKKVYIPCLMIE